LSKSFERTRAKFSHPLGHLVGGLGKLRSLRGRHVEHLEPLGLDASFCKKLLGVLNPSLCSYISFQEMALTFQSPGDEYCVGPFLECLEDIKAVNLARAQKPYYAHVGRVLQSHGAGQVRCVVRAILAAEGNDFWREAHPFQIFSPPSARPNTAFLMSRRGYDPIIKASKTNAPPVILSADPKKRGHI
jgi:hypothetical protein